MISSWITINHYKALTKGLEIAFDGPVGIHFQACGGTR
jgi:hypothetical protein